MFGIVNSFWEERIGSLVAASGVMWGVDAVTKHYTSALAVHLPAGGPMEVIGIGLLIWLHAKYRNSIKA